MNNLRPSSFEAFELEAGRGNVVAVVSTFDTRGRTPIGTFQCISEGARYSFLLESIEGGERIARYSFLGAEPEMIVRGRGEQTLVERANENEVLIVRAVDFVRNHFQRRTSAPRADVGPFAGGAVGYLGYGAARWFEPSISPDSYDEACDDAVFMFYRTVIAFDRVREEINITRVVFPEEAEGDPARLRELYDGAVAETARIEQSLPDNSEERPSIQNEPCLRQEQTPFESNWTRDGFEDAVTRVKEHIAAGDCYQVVLSQRFGRKVSATPISIYRSLQSINPSPYMYLLRLDEETVIGASPEMLVRCQGTRLDYRPIAGTRRRGATETEDLLLAQEMRSDEKELAEHMMLVDLGRNDLGRVATYGSVRVDELLKVESFSHVQHLVSSLSATLRSGLDRFDALASCFPAGTVTGAPKVRAMEIIRELEPQSRGVYAGAVVYADYADNLDSCIAIRTILLKDGHASVQAGAGIVADSVPDLEYQETINKAQALFRAIQNAECRCDGRELQS
ncbi:MAG: anthranilate synthase component I family protein [Pyrinomonadaceae bacterium]